MVFYFSFQWNMDQSLGLPQESLVMTKAINPLLPRLFPIDLLLFYPCPWPTWLLMTWIMSLLGPCLSQLTLGLARLPSGLPDLRLLLFMWCHLCHWADLTLHLWRQVVPLLPLLLLTLPQFGEFFISYFYSSPKDGFIYYWSIPPTRLTASSLEGFLF
jgi:hypothetical protein